MELVNGTGCTVTVSRITGDVICRAPGDECDCLIISWQDEENDHER